MSTGALPAFNRISLVVTPRERATDTQVHESETPAPH
jgi:hypothetical protein